MAGQPASEQPRGSLYPCAQALHLPAQSDGCAMEGVLPRASAHLSSLIHLLCLNGEPLLAGTPSPRRLPGLHRKQVKCVSEVSKTRRGDKPPENSLDLGKENPNPEVGAEDVPHPASSPTQVPSPETTERGTWSFLVLHSTPSCLKAQGSYLAHPTLPPLLTTQKLPLRAIGSEPSCSRSQRAHLHLGHDGPSPSPWSTLGPTCPFALLGPRPSWQASRIGSLSLA